MPTIEEARKKAIDDAAAVGVSADKVDPNYVSAVASGNTSGYINSAQRLGRSKGYSSSLTKKTVTDTNNSNIINSEYRSNEKALLAALRSSIQKSMSKYQTNINNADSMYQPQINQSEVDRNNDARTVAEAAANVGDRGGNMQMSVLGNQVAASNRLNNIGLQKQQYINQNQQAINDIQDAGNQQELQIINSNNSDRLKALLGQGNLDRNFNYQLGRDTIADNRYDTEYADKKSLAEAAATSAAIANAQKNAMTLFEKMGYATPEIAAALGIPEGTTTADYKQMLYNTNKPYYNPNSNYRSSGIKVKDYYNDLNDMMKAGNFNSETGKFEPRYSVSQIIDRLKKLPIDNESKAAIANSLGLPDAEQINNILSGATNLLNFGW